ncbi:MAG: histidine--tRNA ligase [Candidatus Lokiarchaeota archaeon]|nr:histidine--tRNA ligase [Candidatus Lokiarchaeota archaeon]
MSINVQPPSGMRDFLPQEVKKRRYILNIIKDAYEKYGYLPIETPALERLEVIYGKTGAETDKLIFEILKRGEKLEDAIKNSEQLSEYGLRFDLTVPLARFYANNIGNLPGLFKRYQIGPVWRAERAQKGRYREFYQCDIDVIGSDSPFNEVEIILATMDAFYALGFEDFVININDRRILFQILKSLDIYLRDEVLISIDKLDKIGKKEVLKQLIEIIGEDKANKIMIVFDSVAKAKGSIDRINILENAITNLSGSDEVYDSTPYDQLRLIIDTIDAVGEKKNIIFNPYMVRGMTYYTGPIFEITIQDVSFSLAGGGRYDELIGVYNKYDVPACGISIGFERIYYLMCERAMFPKDIEKNEVFMTVFTKELMTDCLKIAKDLRGEGFNVFVYPDFNDKIGRQITSALKNNFKIALFYGEDEKKKNCISVKNLDLNKQDTIAMDLLVDYIKTQLKV